MQEGWGQGGIKHWLIPPRFSRPRTRPTFSPSPFTTDASTSSAAFAKSTTTHLNRSLPLAHQGLP